MTMPEARNRGPATSVDVPSPGFVYEPDACSFGRDGQPTLGGSMEDVVAPHLPRLARYAGTL